MKILAKLFTDYPVFNRMYMNSTSYAQVKTKHIGFAVDTPNGLFVPVVKDVDAKDIMTLSIEIRQLVELALKGMLKPDQMQGGSMSISSLGSITGGFFTPLIPTPQAAILGITKASLMPSMHEGHLIARLMMPVSLSYDHRVINGADAARWLVGLQSMISEVAKLEDTLLIYS